MLSKNRNAVVLGKKGGYARANNLSAEQRTQIARRAAQKRWGVSDMEEKETLNAFAMRIARITGYDDKSQSDEWLQMKAVRIEEVAKALCHYGNGGSGINSCCSGKYRCRTAAAVAAIVKFGDGSPFPM